jgi:hypothetical protein
LDQRIYGWMVTEKAVYSALNLPSVETTIEPLWGALCRIIEIDAVELDLETPLLGVQSPRI